MDLLERARTLAACPLFAGLQPAVVIRLAERARPEALEAGERRTTDDTVWIVGSGSLVIVSRALGEPDHHGGLQAGEQRTGRQRASSLEKIH